MPKYLKTGLYAAVLAASLLTSAGAAAQDAAADKYRTCQDFAARYSGYDGRAPERYKSDNVLEGAVKGAATGAVLGTVFGGKTGKSAKDGAKLGALFAGIRRASERDKMKKKRREYQRELDRCMAS